MYLASIHATSTLDGSARIHARSRPCFSSPNLCHHTGRSHEPARTPNALLTVSSVPSSKRKGWQAATWQACCSTLVHQAEDVVVALTLKIVTGSSAKYALTYSPSFDPILDLPLGNMICGTLVPFVAKLQTNRKFFPQSLISSNDFSNF
jgi:hypothetical protein